MLNSALLQSILVEVLEGNRFLVNEVVTDNDYIKVYATKALSSWSFTFNLEQQCLKVTREECDWPVVIYLSHFLENLSQRGGEEEFTRVLGGLIKSLPL